MQNQRLPAHSNNQAGLITRLRDRLNKHVELMTGIAASGRDELTLSLGHVLQGALKLQFFETLMDELDDYREKGRIKEEDLKTKQGQACFMEMLNFLDEDNPDDIRFEFMKKLYLGIMSDDERDRESVLEQQYLSVARSLNSGEVLVLFGAYRMRETLASSDNLNARQWRKNVAVKSGLKHPELCMNHEDTLTKKRLLRDLNEHSHVEVSPKDGGLSQLGERICKYVLEFEGIDMEGAITD